MALLTMAVFSTEENGKDGYFEKTIYSLLQTVDFKRHRLMLSVNGQTNRTKDILGWYDSIIYGIVENETNIGTARALNKLWVERLPGENVIKIDDDIVINRAGWVDEMEEAIKRDPKIGQVGLKRKDLWEYPGNPNKDWNSELIMLPHTAGEKWIVVEKVKHVIGSCVMHSAALIDKVGGLFQFGCYGFDDVIMSHRCQIEGFYSCFLPHYDIDHIDAGDTPYQSWKEKHSGERTQQTIDLVQSMLKRERSTYFPFE